MLRHWKSHLGMCERMVKTYKEKWYPGLKEEGLQQEVQEENQLGHQKRGIR